MADQRCKRCGADRDHAIHVVMSGHPFEPEDAHVTKGLEARLWTALQIGLGRRNCESNQMVQV